MLAGIHCPKMVEIRENPGRPTHSVPTGLTPPHTWVQYFHWSNVTCSQGSRTWQTFHILSVDPEGTWFNSKTHMSVPSSSNGKPPIPEAKWSAVVQRRRSGGPRGSGGRPPSLPQAPRPKTAASKETTQRTDVQGRSGAVHRRSVARWHTPRPAGLGRAARPHLAASRLPTLCGS